MADHHRPIPPEPPKGDWVVAKRDVLAEAKRELGHLGPTAPMNAREVVVGILNKGEINAKHVGYVPLSVEL